MDSVSNNFDYNKNYLWHKHDLHFRKWKIEDFEGWLAITKQHKDANEDRNYFGIVLKPIQEHKNISVWIKGSKTPNTKF